MLIEHADEAAGLAIASRLRLAGYAVALCSGPHERGECPLTGDDDCAAARDADLVISCLGYEREAAREVVQALRTRCPGVPLVLEVPEGTDPGLGSRDGCRLLTAPADPDGVAYAVHAILHSAAIGERSGA